MRKVCQWWYWTAVRSNSRKRCWFDDQSSHQTQTGHISPVPVRRRETVSTFQFYTVVRFMFVRLDVACKNCLQLYERNELWLQWGCSDEWNVEFSGGVKLELKFHPKLFIIPVRNYILIFHQPRMAEINQSINRDIGFDLFTFYCLQFGNISLSFYKNDTDRNLLATIKVMSNVYRCYKWMLLIIL